MPGYVDAARRPLIDVQCIGGGTFTALIDTGFDGFLFMDDQTAANLGVRLTGGHCDAEFAVEKKTVDIGELEVLWFGTPALVEVLVCQIEASAMNSAVILVGTGLLEDRLMVDFTLRHLEAHKN
jgi:predicted aspartyl protease